MILRLTDAATFEACSSILNISIADHHCRIHTLRYRQCEAAAQCVGEMLGIRLIWERSELYNVCRQIESISSSVWFMGLVRKIILNIHSVPMCIYLCIIQYHKCIRSERRQFAVNQCWLLRLLSQHWCFNYFPGITPMLAKYHANRHLSDVQCVFVIRGACDSMSINCIVESSNWAIAETYLLSLQYSGNEWMQLSMFEFKIFKPESAKCRCISFTHRWLHFLIGKCGRRWSCQP